MGRITLTFLGSGDAFGSGGRFHTCIHVAGGGACFLIDCGASSLIAMKRFGVDPDAIDAVLLTHLHGDHFAGIPFLVLHAQLIARRTRPLVVAGPPGAGERIERTMEALFPGSSKVKRKFELRIVELAPGRASAIGPVTVTPFEVAHPSGAPPFALRVELHGKTIAYSGDTEWTEALIPAARDADLFIAEAYFYDKKIKHHLDLATLLAHMDELRPKRLIVTHMSEDMLRRLEALPCEHAEDGMVVEL